jgi:hypothetical protein
VTTRLLPGCALFVLAACAQQSALAPPAGQVRPANWAQVIPLEGAPNLHRLSDQVYRSEQPTAEGFRNLAALGIRTVINLRYFSDGDEGWTPEDALAELVDGGYGYHRLWKNIRRYVLEADVAKLRAAIAGR